MEEKGGKPSKETAKKLGKKNYVILFHRTFKEAQIDHR